MFSVTKNAGFFLCNISLSVVITAKASVYCAIRIEYLNIFQVILNLKR
jgi:hypothetical protein